jgi:hypothetical protein
MSPDFIRLLSSAQRILGLQLTYHNFQGPSHPLWGVHRHPDCVQRKKKNPAPCVSFCGGEIHRKMTPRTPLSCQTCPFGHSEITAMVVVHGSPAGILYAGAWWKSRKVPPTEGFILRPPKQWIDDQIRMVASVARQIKEILEQSGAGNDPRAEKIKEFLHQNLETETSIRHLSRHLSLSPSRTGHLVKKYLERPFPDCSINPGFSTPHAGFATSSRRFPESPWIRDFPIRVISPVYSGRSLA